MRSGGEGVCDQKQGGSAKFGPRGKKIPRERGTRTYLPDKRQGDTIDDPEDATQAHRAEVQGQVEVIPRLL